ncbi:MAG: hypothetical protein SGJ09_17655, partial [Phycisphaerae bacterium]|nr:hypothetical protein [Phycisphaerae bacterium]
MNRSFESSASFILPLRRSSVLSTLIAATTIGGLPFAGLDTAGPSTRGGASNFGLQAAVAARPVQDTDRDAAKTAAATGQWQTALDKWTAVLNANPGDKEAIAGVAAARAAMDQGSTLSGVDAEYNLRRDRAKVMFEADMQQTQEFVTAGNFGAAKTKLLAARSRLDRDKAFLAPTEYEGMAKQIDDTIAQVTDLETKSDLQNQDQNRKTAAGEAERLRAAATTARQRQIDEGIRRVRQLQLELKYEEALQVVEELLFLDKNNPSALALRDVLEPLILFRQQSEFTRQKEVGIVQQLNENVAAQIPPHRNLSGPGLRSLSGLMQYPEDWPQLSRMRSGAAGWSESEATRQSMMDLRKTISVNFNNNQLDQVVAYMKQVTGVEFYPDWKALEAISVRPEDTVTLQLNDVPAEVALKRILEQIGSDESNRPQYSVEDGVVVVASDESLRQKTLTIVYDIRDLIFEVPYFANAPSFNLSESIQQGNNGGGGGGS